MAIENRIPRSGTTGTFVFERGTKHYTGQGEVIGPANPNWWERLWKKRPGPNVIDVKFSFGTTRVILDLEGKIE